MDEITVDDIGTDLQCTFKESDAIVDVSAATAIEIILKKPDGTETTKTALELTDGTDGVIHYTTVAGDIDQAGIWTYQGKVTFSAGSVFYTRDPRRFRVLP